MLQNSVQYSGGIDIPLSFPKDSYPATTRDNKKRFSVSYMDIGLTAISILQRMSTIILNIILAYEYYQAQKINYFIWTVICIFIPMLVTTMIYITMYFIDERRINYGCFGFTWFIILVPFFFRYFRSLSYAIKNKTAERKNDLTNQKKFFQCMVQEESDVALIRVFECFLEAAPQKIVQLSIILSGESTTSWIQVASIFSCLSSMTWCIVAYHKNNRYSQPDKEKISFAGIIIQFLWHFCCTISRTLSISMVASLIPMWTLYGCFSHASVLAVFVLCFDSLQFCSGNMFSKLIFSASLGIVYIFTYITLHNGRTRYRFIAYHTVCIIENIIMLILYVVYSTDEMKNSPYFIPLCIFSTLPYFIGIIFMTLYYTIFHPNIINRIVT